MLSRIRLGISSSNPPVDPIVYLDEILSLNPDHAWAMETDSVDSVGSADGVDTSLTYTGTELCEGVASSVLMNAVADRSVIPSTSTINSSNQTRKAVGGWFMVNSIQTPPKRIYGEGNNTTCFQIVMAYGNNVMFECVEPTNFVLQVYGPALVPNRIYHLLGIFSGNGFDNEVKFYVDGIQQIDASPANRQPNTANLNSRGVAEFGDPAGTVGIGGDVVILNCPTNANYNYWAAWSEGNTLTDNDVRGILFEKGSLPDDVITSDTQANMQSELDALADSVSINSPLNIRVENVTGNGNLDLTADNITFDSLASIHIQWMGAGTLNYTNTNGANATIGSTPNGGTINFINPATLTINGLINGCEIRIYDDEIPADGQYNTELAGVETLVGTTFDFQHDGSSNTITIQMMAAGYEELIQTKLLSSANEILLLFPVVETNS